MSFIKVSSLDHIRGNNNAPIELIEYGDFQCLYCGQAYLIIKNIQKKLGKNLKFVFRHFPLEEIHPNALHAAIAVETAAIHGKFWEMHDILFENQDNLDDSHIIRYAEKIGLNLKVFEKEFGSQSTIDKVEYDIGSGNRSCIQKTPTFFINGSLFLGNWRDASLEECLQSLI